jgi:polysaccharide pyruvyl transferase WcaK-like protein
MMDRIREAARKASPYYRQILTSKPPRLVYCGGWLGYENLGDEALFLAYRSIFKKHSLIHYPGVGGRVLAIPSRFLGLADAAVLAGGTVINRGTSADSLNECCDSFRHAFVFGSGVADPAFWAKWPSHKDTLKEWKTVLDRCLYVGVRGPRSAEILADIGVDAEVIGDPVVTFCDDALPGKQDIFQQSVGLNVGQSLGRMWADESAIQREFTHLAILAREAGWRTRWFIVWPEDKDLTLQVAKDSKTDAEIYEIYHDPHEFLDLVRPMQVFVGIKLHAVVLATCAYVPSVMLEYRPKCCDYMRSIGQESHTVRTDSFKAESVWEMVQDLSAKRSTISGVLMRELQSLKNLQLQRAEYVMSLITDSRKSSRARGGNC